MNIIEALNDENLLGRSVGAPDTWKNWIVFHKVVHALPMTDEELEIFVQCTGRETPPTKPPKEVYAAVARRAGKTRSMSRELVYRAMFTDVTQYLGPGEKAYAMLLARDRHQAKVAFGYVLSDVTENPYFSPHVVKVRADSIELDNRVTISIQTANFASIRGRAVFFAGLDEMAFWPTDLSANPAQETLTALRPAMAQFPNAVLMGISSPYARSGALYEIWERYYGKDDPDVLVWQADIFTMNPLIGEEVVAQALRLDPDAARAEWYAEWRENVEAFLDPRLIDACVVPERIELPADYRVRYFAAVDVAFKQDSTVLGIAHKEGNGKVVLDRLESWTPERGRPVDLLEDVLPRIEELRREYLFNHLVGDQFASEPLRQLLRQRGVSFQERLFSQATKRDMYGALKTLVHTRRVELLDHPQLLKELKGLETRITPSGGITIGHPKHAKATDDFADVAALLSFEASERFKADSVFGDCDLR